MQLDIGVVEEKSLDINNDGKMDFLVFTSGGEEIFLNIFSGLLSILIFTKKISLISTFSPNSVFPQFMIESWLIALR